MICPNCNKNFLTRDQQAFCPHAFLDGIRFSDDRRRGTANVDRHLVQWQSGNFFREDLTEVYLDGQLFQIQEVTDQHHIILAAAAGRMSNVTFIQATICT